LAEEEEKEEEGGEIIQSSWWSMSLVQHSTKKFSLV